MADGDRRQHLFRLGQSGELDKPDVQATLRLQLLSELLREPGLADPARAGQGDHAGTRMIEKLVQLSQLDRFDQRTAPASPPGWEQ